jgi:hypothetical protein
MPNKVRTRLMLTAVIVSMFSTPSVGRPAREQTVKMPALACMQMPKLNWRKLESKEDLLLLMPEQANLAMLVIVLPNGMLRVNGEIQSKAQFESWLTKLKEYEGRHKIFIELFPARGTNCADLNYARTEINERRQCTEIRCGEGWAGYRYGPKAPTFGRHQ